MMRKCSRIHPRYPRARLIILNSNSYDRYLSPGDDGENKRDSGAVFGVGMGLMGEVSDESDSEDDDTGGPATINGKNHALYKAAMKTQPSPLVRMPSTGEQPTSPPKTTKLPSANLESPSIQKSQERPRTVKENSIPSTPAPPYTPWDDGSKKLQPGPGIRIDIPPRSPASVVPYQSGPPSASAAALNRTTSPMPAPIPQPARPVPAFMMLPSSPAPSPLHNHVVPSRSPVTPHPLPPSTPITPLFAAPPAVLRSSPTVSFQEKETMPILRGNSEDALLERSPNTGGRGKTGEDFWRRFSIVAHEAEADAKRNQSSRYSQVIRLYIVTYHLYPYYSAWLAKTQSKTRVMSRWVWIIGIIVFCTFGAGIGFGIYFSHQRPANTDPGTIGGREDYSMIPDSSTPVKPAAPTTSGGGGLTRSARAVLWEPAVVQVATGGFPPSPTPAAVSRRRHRDFHSHQVAGRVI